jgi:hypothetical protein
MIFTYRIALRARADAARQERHERMVPDMRQSELPSELDRHELRSVH